MADTTDYRKVIEDFVLGDRRLADRKDIRIDSAISAANQPVQVEWDQRSVPVRIQVGSYLIRLQTDELSPQELQELTALPLLLGYDAHSHPLGLTVEGRLENRIRTTLAANTESGRVHEIANALSSIAPEMQPQGSEWSTNGPDLAIEVGATRTRRYLSIVASPSASLYRALYALGVLCRPKTALVRVIDISPELLRILQENPHELRSLGPDQFESFVANRLDRMGYNVTLTGPTTRKDGGIDIIALPKAPNVGSVVLAAQVKHHRADQKTGRDAVDRLLAWKGSQFGVGMLVTNTAFSRDALWAAAQERNRDFLRLRDFIDLKRWLQDQYGSSEDWREIPHEIELAPGILVEVPKPNVCSAASNSLNDET